MKADPKQDLEHIRNMMERSSRFISLSGLSGIFAGIFALMAAVAAWLVFKNQGTNYFNRHEKIYSGEVLQQLLLICVATLVLAIGSAWYFTYQKSRKKAIPMWNSVTRRLLVSFGIPLVAGGVFCLALLVSNAAALVAPSMLVFYGFSLINASKYTYSDINFLGYFELILGLIAMFYTGYGLLFWAIGFGFLHIIYGIVMYKKYE